MEGKQTHQIILTVTHGPETKWTQEMPQVARMVAMIARGTVVSCTIGPPPVVEGEEYKHPELDLK